MKKLRTRLKAWMGVDPGKQGALVLITEKGNIRMVDWPSDDSNNTMCDVVGGLLDTYDIQLCVLEKNNARPGQAVKSTHSTGRNLGKWEIILRNVPTLMLTPGQWRKGLVSKEDDPDPKKANKKVAERMFPNEKHKMYGPKGGYKDGRADALLMAYVAKQRR